MATHYAEHRYSHPTYRVEEHASPRHYNTYGSSYRAPATYDAYPSRYGSANYRLEDPVDPRNYNGTVIGVEYVVHAPGWSPQHGPHHSTSLPHHSAYPSAPLGHREAPYYSSAPHSYRPLPHHEEPHYGGASPRYGHPAGSSPHYAQPAPPVHYDVPLPHVNLPHSAQRSVAPPIMDTSNLRPWFGVALKWLDNIEYGGQNNVAVVHEAVANSPAWKAGIQVDDQIEYWDNVKVDSEAVWKRQIGNMNVGDVVNLGIRRAGRDMRVLVRIEGTDQVRGPKRVVNSANAAHTGM